MAVPSSQIIAAWVKSELSSTEWVLLHDLCLRAVTKYCTRMSQESVSDIVEENLPYVAEHLRDEVAEQITDGSSVCFEIDNEQDPYMRRSGYDASELLEIMRKADPFKVEVLCAKVLEKIGAISSVTQQTNDGGVDFIGTNICVSPSELSMPEASRACVIGQTKRYKDGNIINEKQLREFVGAAVLKRHQLAADGKLSALTPVIFAFWTTSDFEPNAKKFARSVGLWFMNGHTLADYVAKLGLESAIL